MNAAEVQSLFISQPDVLLQDLNLDTAAHAALTKLLAILPELLRQNAQSMQNRIHIDLQGWRNTREDISQLAILQQAVWNGCVTKLDYRRSDGEMVARSVHPLGLVAKGSIWYLVAACGEQIRTYRVSRVIAAQATNTPVRRPAEFDLAAYWEQSKREFVTRLPEYPVRLRADEGIVPRLYTGGWYSKVISVSEPDGKQWCTVEMVFEVEENAAAFVLSFGGQVEVLEPDSLRQHIIELAKGTLRVYE